MNTIGIDHGGAVAVIEFTIFGNQENRTGNPIPYYRQTARSKWKNAGAKRYHRWKDFVRLSLLAGPGGRQRQYALEPLDGTKCRLDCMIWFANRKHGDPENVRKGIQDALFKQDKYVIGSVDFGYDAACPRVEIKIGPVI